VSTAFPVLLHSWTWRTLQLLPHLPRLRQGQFGPWQHRNRGDGPSGRGGGFLTSRL